MATEVGVQIRISSVADQFAMRGMTEKMVLDAIRRVQAPQGRYGPLQVKALEMRSHSHDNKWGLVVWCGTLAEFNDSARLQNWWADVVLGIDDVPQLEVAHGVLQYGVDGQPWVEVNHVGAITTGIERLGDEVN